MRINIIRPVIPPCTDDNKNKIIKRYRRKCRGVFSIIFFSFDASTSQINIRNSMGISIMSKKPNDNALNCGEATIRAIRNISFFSNIYLNKLLNLREPIKTALDIKIIKEVNWNVFISKRPISRISKSNILDK